MEAHLYQTLYSQLAKTFFALLIVILIYTVTALASRRIERKSMRERFKIRLFYVSTFIFLALMIHIWLRGFGTIFAVIGFALAALIVTNKESIMNFTGFLIIQWRELFTEGDQIQIGTVNGEVRKIGVLYITILEYLSSSNSIPTGRITRIPNGQVITGQVINYSQTSHFLAYAIPVVFTLESDLASATKLITDTIKKVLTNHYQNKFEYSKDYLEKKDKYYLALINWEPFVDISFHQEKPFGIQLKAHYYCYSSDHDNIEREIYLSLIPAIQNHDKIKLSYLT
jgi:small-conductance mechanosensitive channel